MRGYRLMEIHISDVTGTDQGPDNSGYRSKLYIYIMDNDADTKICVCLEIIQNQAVEMA